MQCIEGRFHRHSHRVGGGFGGRVWPSGGQCFMWRDLHLGSTCGGICVLLDTMADLEIDLNVESELGI